jgi:hypothetical protein
MPRSKAWLCVGPVLLCLLDQGLTLLGQPQAYWQGHFAAAFEGNPLLKTMLRHGHAGLLLMPLWLAVVCGLVLALPRRFAMAASIAIMLGHTWGAATWMSWMLPGGYWACMALFGLSGVMIALTWDFAHRHPRAVPRPCSADAGDSSARAADTCSAYAGDSCHGRCPFKTPDASPL